MSVQLVFHRHSFGQSASRSQSAHTERVVPSKDETEEPTTSNAMGAWIRDRVVERARSGCCGGLGYYIDLSRSCDISMRSVASRIEGSRSGELWRASEKECNEVHRTRWDFRIMEALFVHGALKHGVKHKHESSKLVKARE